MGEPASGLHLFPGFWYSDRVFKDLSNWLTMVPESRNRLLRSATCWLQPVFITITGHGLKIKDVDGVP